MPSPWNRRVNRSGRDRRLTSLHRRFRRLGTVRVPRRLAVLILGLLVVGGWAVMQRVQVGPESLPGAHQLQGFDDGFEYRNCAAARAAGDAPLRRGQPGYGPHLDRDNDGVGCEPYLRR